MVQSMADISSNNSSNKPQVDRNVLLSGILQAIRGLGIQIGAKSGSATAGSATLPGAPVGFFTLTFSDGSTGKVPYYAP
jgi:hypothetical protein